ncbi:hypothetical protein [Actinomadura gamaensis]|uniref:Uncharacterized protein n=1 Tax=Actinomadura gamaensis TaxID=1763541 RepID=A0ABV9TTR8_9ACTN
MIRHRRGGTTRRIGDLIDDTLDRASDVEHDLRRAARKAVENRDDDDRDGGRYRDRDRHDGRRRDDRDDDRRYRDDDYGWDYLDEILDDLRDLCRRRRHPRDDRDARDWRDDRDARERRDGRRERPYPRDRERDARARTPDGDVELADQLARLNRRLEEVAHHLRSDDPDEEDSR